MSWIRPTTRAAILARDKGRCQYCYSEAASDLDHVTPRCHGGPNLHTNLVTSCGRCNRRKAGRDLRVMTKIERRRARRALKRPLNRELGRFIVLTRRLPF